jgi:hypothetical protein
LDKKKQMLRTRSLLPPLLAVLCVLGPRCSNPAGPEDITEFKAVTIIYERVPPIPDPGGVGQPVLSWLYYHGGEAQQGSPSMTTIDETTFSADVGIRTETQVALHVVDPQYPDWVCRRLYVEAVDVARQEIPADELYGQVAFILGNDRIIRRVGGAVDSAAGPTATRGPSI